MHPTGIAEELAELLQHLFAGVLTHHIVVGIRFEEVAPHNLQPQSLRHHRRIALDIDVAYVGVLGGGAGAGDTMKHVVLKQLTERDGWVLVDDAAVGVRVVGVRVDVHRVEH